MTPVARPPVFLDRDGTLIVEKHYLRDPEGVHLEEGVVKGLLLLQNMGCPLIVLSNQSGIARGLFTAADAQRVNLRVDEMLRGHGVEILGWYVCPHIPESACDCRKPLPGLAREAARDHGLTTKGSYVIGDKRSDVELAHAIGGTGILLTTGHGVQAAHWAEHTGTPVFGDLHAAAQYIQGHEGGDA